MESGSPNWAASPLDQQPAPARNTLRKRVWSRPRQGRSLRELLPPRFSRTLSFSRAMGVESHPGAGPASITASVNFSLSPSGPQKRKGQPNLYSKGPGILC